MCTDRLATRRPTRRSFLRLAGAAALYGMAGPHGVYAAQTAVKEGSRNSPGDRLLCLFLCGDVMTGRGIDQILPHPGKPQLHEPYVRDARDYVRLAERSNGPVDRPVEPAYPWGDALAELARAGPDVRLINLETAITVSDAWRPKGINYRMHPANIGCLTAAGVDCCALANNHVLDWGEDGLVETLQTLDAAGIRHAGAGRDLGEARAPAILEVPGKGRVVVFSCGSRTSGIGGGWAAGRGRPGVYLLQDFSPEMVDRLDAQVRRVRRDGDLVVVSIHWGGNWEYRISPAQRDFAHALIERAGVDVVHGHSSHHVKGIEVHRGKLVLYGCGDLLTDYEGISGHEAYRGDLGLLYFASLEPGSGQLRRLAMVPTRMRRLRIQRAAPQEVQWLAGVLNREGRPLGSGVCLDGDHRLALHWRQGEPGGGT